MSTNGTTNGTTKGGFTPIEPGQVAKLGMAAYRAPSLLQPHRAREALSDAHAGRIPPLIGYFSCLASPPIAKIVAQLGFDVVLIDWEHSAMNAETMTQVRYTKMCQSFYTNLVRWFTTFNSSAKEKPLHLFGMNPHVALRR
jgi:4-hydroxy-2-oxoheptanedioate aldolase